MWSDCRDRGAKNVDETVNILNSLSKHQIYILSQLESPLNTNLWQAGALRTLTAVDLTLQSLGHQLELFT